MRRAIQIIGAVACLVTPAAAAGSFDGVYRGTQKVTQSNNSADCAKANSDSITLQIANNHFSRHWYSTDLPVDVEADGSFSASAVLGQRPLRVLEMKGRITGGNLEADIGTSLCTAHMSLKKS